MSLTETLSVQCPYCWESIEVLIDCSVEEQRYVEDCFVCCRPIVLHVRLDAQGWPEVHAERESD